MKRNLALGFLAVLIAVASCSFTNKSFENNDKDKLLLDIITYILEKGHYSPKAINDDLSVAVYEDFIDVLDPTKRYFLAEDIRDFEQYKFQIDDQIKNTDISFFNLVNERYAKRIGEVKVLISEILDEPFDYTVEESINSDYDKRPFTNSRAELKERWRKQLKFWTLNTFDSKLKDEIQKKKDDPNYVTLTEREVEKEARDVTRQTLEEFFDFVDNMERKDRFAQYINSIVDKFDPHTSYFAPEDKDYFDRQISGRFEGIGARLQPEPEGAKIVEIISGGPVWRGQLLEVGDEIIKVGQENETPVNIVGMPLDDAVKLIKGPKGTKVYLTVRKVDGTIEEVTVVRDIVELEEQYAKSAKIIDEDKKFGLIQLPGFYADFKNYNDRNAATDVAKEIERLKGEGMEGLILDLRDNGGGSLRTAIDMAGLFIKDGPVVQVRASDNDKMVYEDKDERIQWDGPLVILVNEFSASASEILAAAMQDYKRAIIIGSSQTFGKGTVQTMYPLENVVHVNEYGDLGAIKVTIQKFYRVNGESNQLEGVKSDIVIPDRYRYIVLGEKGQPTAMSWDKINPANYRVWDGNIDFEKIIENSNKRIAQNPQVKLIEENAKWLKDQQDEMTVTLNYDLYKARDKANREKSDYFKKLSEYDSQLTFESVKYEQELFTQDTLLKEKRERWHKNLVKDVYIEEAVNVLKDLRDDRMNSDKLAHIKG
ncbi:carboxy terminal-processing peptidase [Muriicola marianensis]|uniref:Tail-specific protease n=1 Tax=Muriicola marianensis TaxID=1324801 RepID=A0ABQ1R3N4_9FLAO|nr:carboxy terminal-processing peptidase [Muriicola marianensis]GGD53809.1 tail-specific protease [Muriicola marianensis]